MRIFAKAVVSTLLEAVGMEEGVPIESKMISSGSRARRKPSRRRTSNQESHLLEYDDVMNKQREAV